MRTVSADPFTSLAAALAEWPTLRNRLLLAHPAATRTSVCPTCTTPGGRRVVETPCGPRNLALLAARIAGGRA